MHKRFSTTAILMNMPNQTVIDCQKLSKRYGRSPAYALQDLSLAVQSGEIYGFLGPNGAGKSTTIRTLLNFIQPSSGQAAILGLDIVRDSVAIKRELGYLAGEVMLYGRMTGQQFLDYLSSLQPLKHRPYLAELVDIFGADLQKPLHSLSKGNRQKIGVIQALMHEPAVLILDEPTSGLDPLMQAAFYEVIETAKRRGAAIFLSSHDLAEVHKMCDRVGFIRAGKLVAERTIADIQSLAAHRFDITFADKPPLTQLHKIPNAAVQTLSTHTVTVQLQGNLQPLFALLAKHPVTALDKHDVNLEEEFLHLYEDQPEPKI